MSEKNIVAMYNRASEWDVAEGMTWYEEAFRLCTILSRKYDRDVNVVAAVLAALSPRNKWAQNVKDTEVILAAAVEGLPVEDIRVGTTNLFRDRAYEIARTGKIGLLKGPKVWSFWKDIVDNRGTDRVTVDVWAYRIAAGDLKAAPKLDYKAYNHIERQYQRAARKLGLLPLQLQAITWVTARRYAKVKGHLNQLSFF